MRTFKARPRGGSWSLCRPGAGRPASFSDKLGALRPLDVRQGWGSYVRHSQCPLPGPRTGLFPAEGVHPGQACWRAGRPA